MAKKQVESTLFEEVWFMDLDLEYKMLMLYFFITCDHAGLGNLNFKMINMVLGHEYDKENVFIFLGDHIDEYKPNKYRLKKYMKFHYSEDNKSQIYKSAIKKLKREGLDYMSQEDQEAYDRSVSNGYVSDKFLKG
tara:strand:+ start:3006 stop:3410 length:405 start_codon:yes stop_codon:yes gene_type:complete